MKTTISAAPLPTNFRGTPQQLIDALLDRLEITIDGSSFVTGDIMPGGNEGPWLKGGTQWWVWDVNTSTYIPLDISQSETPRIFVGDVSAGAPDSTIYQIWLQLNGTKVNGVFAFMGTTLGWVTAQFPAPAAQSITSLMIQNGAIGTGQLADGSVTAAKLASHLPPAILSSGQAFQVLQMDNNGANPAWRSLLASSPNLSFSNVITWAHGLSSRPTFVRAVWACISDDSSSGYKAGDEIDANFNINTGSESNGMAIVTDGTNVTVIRLPAYVWNKNGSGNHQASTDSAHFQVKIYAGLF